VSAVQTDQEARRAAEMVLAILGQHVDHEEGMGGVWLGPAEGVSSLHGCHEARGLYDESVVRSHHFHSHAA
jgi:hypothetical protein